MVKPLLILIASLAAFLSNPLTCSSQLIVKGTVTSEGLTRVTFKSDQSAETIPMYLYEPKEIIEAGDTFYIAKYEAPIRMLKNHNYIMRFTDGTVEKTIYVSGAVPEGIIPKQKFRVDIKLIDPDDPDMTLILFWSMSQSSYRALPLSEIETIRTDACPDFFWEDGTIPDNEKSKKTGF